MNASKEATGIITKGEDGNLYQVYNVNLYAQNGDVKLNSVTDILGSKQKLASKVTFTNTNKDNTTSSTEYKDFAEIKNITITVQLTANGNPYVDSVVLHASESDMDNWTYTWDNLPKSDAAGEINYSVKEIEAPEGYTVSAVTDTESRVITLTNTYTNGKGVTFSKENVAGKELPSATMSISDKNGEEVYRWLSTSEKNVVTLAPGNDTLTELTAPNGYLKAQSIDFTLDAEGKVTVDDSPVTEVSAPKGYELAESITFNVDLNGKVTIDGKEVTAVVMKDAKKPANVQTGVHTNVCGFGALGGFSIGMAFIILFLRKKMD